MTTWIVREQVNRLGEHSWILWRSSARTGPEFYTQRVLGGGVVRFRSERRAQRWAARLNRKATRARKREHRNSWEWV